MAQRKINLNKLPSNNETVGNISLRGDVRTKPTGGVANRIRDITNALFAEIVIPTFQDGLINFLNEGVTRLVRGWGGNTSFKPRPKVHTAYEKPYRRKTRTSPIRRTQGQTPRHIQKVFDDVYFDNRRDAEEALGILMSHAAEYGWVTVGDLYHLVGLNADYTHQSWGWTELHGVRVQYTTEGYVMSLPEPIYLK
jgi:hypothetical protein